jgi:hypothetical protein
MLTSAAHADGMDNMFDAQGTYIDTLEIIDDVYWSFWGGDVARFQMAAMDMTFYIPQDAAYITIDASNPIIAGKIPHYGVWVSTAGPGRERWPDCPGAPLLDHQGVPRPVWGDVTYTWTALEGYDLYFNLKLGFCGGEVSDWAFNDPKRNDGRPVIDATPDPAPDPGLVPVPQPPANDADVSADIDLCRSAPDLDQRTEACGRVAVHPKASEKDASWAYWTRAVTQCSTAPLSQVREDLYAAITIDPSGSQEYYRDIGEYNGPMDGQTNEQLYDAADRYSSNGC